MSGLDPQQVLTEIIRPALDHIGHGGADAEALVLNTGAIESDYVFLRQTPRGPGRGLWQMEPETHDWLWEWMRGKVALMSAVSGLSTINNVDALTHCLRYAAAMCRIRYLPVRGRLPAWDDIPAQAKYWKKWYNAAGSRGLQEPDFVKRAERVMRSVRGLIGPTTIA